MRPIVAFDFDGTLTVRDSFIAFLAWRTPPLRRLWGLLALTPALAGYLLHRDRGRLKAQAVRVFLRGVPREALAAAAAVYADQAAHSLLRPDALARWEEHRRAGAWLVIVTASPDILVEPFANWLDADTLIGTCLAYDDQDQVTGALDGPNCRGAEKVRRLREAFGAQVSLAVAYGDTAGDIEMLALAEQGVMRAFSQTPASARPSR